MAIIIAIIFNTRFMIKDDRLLKIKNQNRLEYFFFKLS
jgi:hypothetical protein